MVFVKVRETYDLHTVTNKMTVIGIHTPKSDIIKRNYPGLLMQCKAYRPVSCDVKIACASMMPLDPQGVGTSPGDVAPEDVFNPILYKAMSNFGMSQLEARIHGLAAYGADVQGSAAIADVDTASAIADEFPIYYGLLSDTNSWKHASAQSGLTMSNLQPRVWELLYNIGDQNNGASPYGGPMAGPQGDSEKFTLSPAAIRGNSKPMPFINTTSYTKETVSGNVTGIAQPGFNDAGLPANVEMDVPYLQVFVGAIIIPPSRLHELFYRMVVEWTLEFSQIRSVLEITDFPGLAAVGNATHYQNYTYSATKQAITGSSDTIMDSDTSLVAANVDINKVM